MRLLLLGLLVGGLSGYLLRLALVEDDPGARIAWRSLDDGPRERPPAPAGDDGERERLRALVAELEAKLAACRGAPDAAPPAAVAVPATDAEIDQLLEEFQQTDDLDRLLALIEALLLQGERGYPKLTQVLMRVVGKVMARRLREEEVLQRVVPAMRLALRHEQRLVGYVGYLLTAENVPGPMRQGAMGAAMFLSVNGVKGSETFGPQLLETFLAEAEGGKLRRNDVLLEAMGFLRQKEAVDPLLRLLKDPAQEEIHARVIDVLGRIGDARAIGPIVQRLQSGGAGGQWWSPELQALGRIGTPEASAAAREHLASLADDNQFFGQAGSYLRQQADERVVTMVRDRFRANPANPNLWSAMWGLTQAATPSAAAVLEEMAANPAAQPQIRQQAQAFLDQRKKLEEPAER